MEENIRVPGPTIADDLSQLLYEFCRLVDAKYGTKNGKTTLYWHLHGDVIKHLGSRSETQ